MKNHMPDLKNQLVLITGASRGIGRATALVLAKEGATLALLARNEKDLDSIALEISKTPGRAHVYPVDLEKIEEIIIISNQIKKDLGVPNIIINSAGQGRFLFLEETPLEEIQPMINLPFIAALHITRLFLPEMIQRNSGHIINIGSPASHLPWPGATVYSCSRWALRGLSESLWADLYRTNLHVSHILPGKVSSSYFSNNPGSEDRLPKLSNFIPTLTPEDVGKSVLKTIINKKRIVIIPFSLKLTFYFFRLFPRITHFLIYQTGHRRN